MRKLVKKETLSNIIFVIAIAALLYTPSRIWIMRQLAFTPSIKSVEKREVLDTYQWSLKGLNTDDIQFNDLKGKVILVNFWATWCPSCRAEKPMLNDLYEEFKDRVTFISITSEDKAKVNTFNTKNNFTIPAYNMYSNPPEIFTRTNTIPASYIIDKQGSVVVSKTGAGKWDSNKMRKLLNELIAA